MLCDVRAFGRVIKLDSDLISSRTELSQNGQDQNEGKILPSFEEVQH
jgi:hypothetical protein